MSTKASDHNLSEAESEQRGRLIRQMIYAACAIGVLLGVLVFFNYLSGSAPEKPEAPTFTEPVPVPPKRPQIRPVTPGETPADDPVAGSDSGLPDVIERQPPVDAEQPPDDLPPVEPPVIQTPPASTQTPTSPVSTPAVKPPVRRPPATSAAPPVEDVPELSAPPSVALPPEPLPAAPPATPPVAVQTPPASAVQPTTSSAPRPVSGFVVQAGVFANIQRAEDLHAKLVRNGIPATLETRVQVGPFKTQAEAQAVRAKMKALGIEGVVLPPPPGR